ncbi:leucine-rich repeat domain-containing protein [Fulvivirga sp. M361]|uniref:leucine-rich repeat domain-containing protein n=1 Tax=Fulvivirga sp. M361 TaxID=2594266 RepID=UPI001179C032|nr:leucine-rich repeat domain-containing protein [Fulvivirga sp. M361]TRX48595.1 leucine-rich repeat domain-containing protein [Fulvivirga sp. M361]
MSNKIISFCCWLSLIPWVAFAQPTEDEIATYEGEAREMVGFLGYMMNTMGNPNTSARDKEVIVSQSFKKIFRDGEVQIQDDLDEARNVITNKDVTAYLKDIDFFFRSANFEINVEDIQNETTTEGGLFFKITASRRLSAISINGDSVNNTQPRFIEINVDPENKELKIVSMYTRAYDRTKYLTTWWKELSYEWRSLFKKELNLISDSLTPSQINKVVGIASLDLSGNRYINSIAPLSELTDLKNLNLQGTNIKDLSPLRNLNHLTHLNASGTRVTLLEPLKYAGRLRELNLKNTQIDTLRALARLSQLEYLDISRSAVNSLQDLSELTKLNRLDISGTRVNDLTGVGRMADLKEFRINSTTVAELGPLAGLQQLTALHMDSTLVNDLTPLKESKALEILSINSCNVTSLDPLNGLEALRKIYCDRTGINHQMAKSFMDAHNGVIVVYDSEDLLTWWSALPEVWQSIFNASTGINTSPSKEELAKVVFIDSLNISGRKVFSLDPIINLDKLRYLNASNTSVSRLEPLTQLSELTYLDLSSTDVESVDDLARLDGLETLIIQDTYVDNLQSLHALAKLTFLDLNDTQISEEDIIDYLETHSKSLVLYKTEHLTGWWQGLNSLWKSVLGTAISAIDSPSAIELHQAAQVKSLEFENVAVQDLSPLQELMLLKDLALSGTRVTSLSPLNTLDKLRRLKVNKTPIVDLSPIADLKLTDLDVSNTGVVTLEPLQDMISLNAINCSGTPLKRLRGLENLSDLQSLDCSNTAVKKLDEVKYLNLKALSCFNTKISDSRLDSYREENPDCKITFY